ncbi:hypothetical protein TSUD_249640 [Trifolium subterraneum]|nr:hypothetical protein TSUD_249640 [Trifolium subterraneum]
MYTVDVDNSDSPTASVLVNGSPTDEFPLERGLRQGDPLSHFLFLLAAKGLNVLMEAAMARNLFTGYSIGEAASALCRKVGKIPFFYLGLPIGGDPRRLSFWEPVLVRLDNRLSGWKSRFLSFGGRLVLLKYGVERGRLRDGGRRGSSWWKEITRIREGSELGGSWFGEHVSKRVGDGSDTYFWTDPWVDEIPFCVRFGRLFDLAENKVRTVAERFSLGWGVDGEEWEWRRQLWAWEEEMLRECYTVRGAYHLLTSQDAATMDDADKLIWHSQLTSALLVMGRLSRPITYSSLAVPLDPCGHQCARGLASHQCARGLGLD